MEMTDSAKKAKRLFNPDDSFLDDSLDEERVRPPQHSKLVAKVKRSLKMISVVPYTPSPIETRSDAAASSTKFFVSGRRGGKASGVRKEPKVREAATASTSEGGRQQPAIEDLIPMGSPEHIKVKVITKR